MKVKNVLMHYCGNVVHRFWVGKNLLTLAGSLIWRAIVHDLSKYRWREAKYFCKTIDKFSQTEYGTLEYKSLMDEIRPGITLHQTSNSHHPEYYPNGIHGMTSLDLLEMMCDWQAASRRGKNGNVLVSIEKNQSRFGYDDTTKNIFIKILRDIGVGQ